MVSPTAATAQPEDILVAGVQALSAVELAEKARRDAERKADRAKAKAAQAKAKAKGKGKAAPKTKKRASRAHLSP